MKDLIVYTKFCKNDNFIPLLELNSRGATQKLKLVYFPKILDRTIISLFKEMQPVPVFTTRLSG